MGGIPAAFSIHLSMNKGAKVISEAILGRDFRTVVIAGKAYTVHPPTIERMAGAISHLSGVQATSRWPQSLERARWRRWSKPWKRWPT